MNRVLLGLSVGIMLMNPVVYLHNIFLTGNADIQNETEEHSEDEWLSEEHIV